MGAEGAVLNIEAFWMNFASLYWKKIKDVVIFGDEILNYKVENELGYNFTKKVKERMKGPSKIDKEYEDLYNTGYQ